MKKEDVQDFTGLTEWEYNRIFYEHPEDCLKRLHRSPKMAFKTLEARLAKQNLDPCQETFSIHLWNWIRDEYLCELADEVEQLIEENIFQDISEKDGFVICEDELNEVGLLMLMHIMEQQDSGMKAFE